MLLSLLSITDTAVNLDNPLSSSRLANVSSNARTAVASIHFDFSKQTIVLTMLYTQPVVHRFL